MTDAVVGSRYARALFELADEQNVIEKVGRDIEDFAAMYGASPELRAVFENPAIAASSRRSVLEQLAARAGMHLLVRNTLLLLSERGRLRSVASLAAAYRGFFEAKSGRVRAEVTTATPMPDAYFQELQRTLEAVTGQRVSIVRKQDPAILGGVVARIGDRVFDGSMKSQLRSLEQELVPDT